MDEQKTVHLKTKKDLDVYMNPQRQRLLREMRLKGEPMTPKELSVRLEISPSSVQHHIGRLLGLGVVELDHTERINGITARYYAVTQTTISFGMDRKSELMDEKEIHVKSLMAEVEEGFFENKRKRLAKGEAEALSAEIGDLMAGIAFLAPEEGAELLAKIREFVQSRERRGPGQVAWEYAVIAYRVEETEETDPAGGLKDEGT